MPPRKNIKSTNGVDAENVLNTNETEKRSLRTRKTVNYREIIKRNINNSTDMKETNSKEKKSGGSKNSEESLDSSSKKTKSKEAVSEPVKEKTKTKSKVPKEKGDEPDKKSTSKRKSKLIEKDTEKKLTKITKPVEVDVKKKSTKRKEKVVAESTSAKKSKRDISLESVSSKGEEEEQIKKPSKKRSGSTARAKSPKSVKQPKNKTANDWTSIDYSCNRFSEEKKEATLKIASWNVDGIRAWYNKGGFEYIVHEMPHVFCIQETKSSYDKLPDEIKSFKGYHQYWSSASKEGYSGVGLFTKKMPLSVINGIHDEEHDAEGRIITAEFEYYYIVSVYVPNSGRGLVTLPKRLDWNKKFLNFINDLNKKKPVIICGDMNVAHQEIDLKNPKTNKKNAGFTQEERDGMTEFLSNGYVDTFRKLYPEKKDAYTFWTYMSNSRAKNTGWRIDYFLISERLVPKLCDNVLRTSIYGSDHCPIVLFMSF